MFKVGTYNGSKQAIEVVFPRVSKPKFCIVLDYRTSVNENKRKYFKGKQIKS